MLGLLVFVLLTAGCATMVGPQPVDDQGGTAAARMPFPAAQRDAPLEPTVVSYPDYRDPLILLNRGIFAFNDVTYRYLLIPLSKGYVAVVPSPVRTGVGNFFDNVKTPITAVNQLLQGEFSPLGQTLLRFGINTTVGLLGLFDPARDWAGLERTETDFAETLAGYGVGYGVYLVLPLFGPSDLRGSASLVADHYLNPFTYLTDNPEQAAILGFDFFQDYAPGAERYETLRRKAEDPYLFFRNLYLQGVQRDAAH